MTRAAIPADVFEAIEQLRSGNRVVHGQCFELLQRVCERRVDWADAAWPLLLDLLSNKDNRVRSIAGQTLCSLASSASSRLVVRDLDALIEATRDERFVTARHILLALWKIGVADAALRTALVARLSARYGSCAGEKNATLVRYDILCTLRRLFEATADEAVKTCASRLIPLEPDAKYRKKYSAAWRQSTLRSRCG